MKDTIAIGPLSEFLFYYYRDFEEYVVGKKNKFNPLFLVLENESRASISDSKWE